MGTELVISRAIRRVAQCLVPLCWQFPGKEFGATPMCSFTSTMRKSLFPICLLHSYFDLLFHFLLWILSLNPWLFWHLCLGLWELSCEEPPSSQDPEELIDRNFPPRFPPQKSSMIWMPPKCLSPHGRTLVWSVPHCASRAWVTTWHKHTRSESTFKCQSKKQASILSAVAIGTSK